MNTPLSFGARAQDVAEGAKAALGKASFDLTFITAPLDVPLRANAARLEAGNPSLLGLFVLDNALAVLEGLDGKAVLAHAHELGGEVIEGLRRLGLPVITPDAGAERAGNVCFLAQDGHGLAARLAERGVLVWGGDERVRISAHVHDDSDDVGRCLEALAAIGAKA